MKETPTVQQGRGMMARWVEMSNEAYGHARNESVSEILRCSTTFESGYVCALFLFGSTAPRVGQRASRFATTRRLSTSM